MDFRRHDARCRDSKVWETDQIDFLGAWNEGSSADLYSAHARVQEPCLNDLLLLVSNLLAHDSTPTWCVYGGL